MHGPPVKPVDRPHRQCVIPWGGRRAVWAARFMRQPVACVNPVDHQLPIHLKWNRVKQVGVVVGVIFE